MKLGILVSGGDAPGLNAVIYGAYSGAKAAGARLFGIAGGFKGVPEGRVTELKGLRPELVQAPGSILATGRHEAFREKTARLEVLKALKEYGLSGIVVAGGNGSLTGARLLAEWGYPVIGVPATVDGDVFATEEAVGFSTGVQAVANAIAALHSTSAAYPGRVFLLETLGGKRGYLALMAGIAAAADFIVIPETGPTTGSVAEKVGELLAENRSAVGVVCEGADSGWKGGDQNYITVLGERILEKTGVRARYSVAGYGLRGERPVAFDCGFGYWCGRSAAEALLAGESGLMTGTAGGSRGLFPLDPAAKGFDIETWMSVARRNGQL